MFFKFPYQYGFLNGCKIPYPIVKVYLKTLRGQRSFSFIMDTGADNLTLPLFMSKILGVDLKKLKKGKDTILWAVFGLVIIFMSYIIINFVFTIFGGEA